MPAQTPEDTRFHQDLARWREMGAEELADLERRVEERAERCACDGARWAKTWAEHWRKTSQEIRARKKIVTGRGLRAKDLSLIVRPAPATNHP